MGLADDLASGQRDESHFLNVYCSQIADQCRAAVASLQAVAAQHQGPWDLDSMFWNLDHAVNRAAMVSKMLWPVSKGFATERGAFLREKLGVSDGSPLSSRVLRNHLEHFDERIDKWYKGSGTLYADKNVGPASMLIFPGNPKQKIFRHYDPETGIYSFHGDSLNLVLLQEALITVLGEAQKHNRVVRLSPDWKVTFE